MKQVSLEVEDVVYAFYCRVGAQVGRTPERVMADGLLRQAGELSHALRRPIPFPGREG